MKWPFTIIITPKSLEMYSRITVFLLQIKYSRQCLEIDCFTPRDNDGKGLGSIKSVPLSSSSAFKQGINKSSGMSGVGVSNISELRSKRIAFRMELMHFIIGLQTHLFSSVSKEGGAEREIERDYVYVWFVYIGFSHPPKKKGFVC